MFTCCQSFPKFCNHEIVIGITVSWLSMLECPLLSITMWSIWLWVFPSGEVQLYLWMFWCGNIVLFTTRCSALANFNILTPLSLLSWCRFSFQIVGLKIFSLPTITVKSPNTRIGTLIVATIYLRLIQNRYMFRSFTVLQCSHQHCVQPVASDVEVVGYL